jgi:5-methylcytosine-specific restriction endonuclease McrA
MEGTAPPAPAGSVPSSERLRHGPNSSPTAADAALRSEVADALADGTVTEIAVAEVTVAEVLDVAGADTCKQLPPSDSVSGRVLVLNATYEPINVCSIRRAVVLLLKEKAEMLERNARELHSERYTVARPVVIRLVSYVRVPRQAHRRKITRRAVFARDGWACQYCGSRSNLTVDHVIPRSKGGQSSWENIVASCGPCNRRKGDSLLAQAGMELRRAPRTPRAEIFIHVSAPTIPSAWQPYLAQAA